MVEHERFWRWKNGVPSNIRGVLYIIGIEQVHKN